MNLPLALHNLAFLSLLLVLAFAACVVPGGLNPVPPASSPTTSPTPSATPIPLAITVNGEGVTVPEFDAEVARYQKAQAALGNTVSLETARKNVSDTFIDIFLLEQTASAEGFSVDDAMVQSRIDDLAAQVGGLEALSAWQTTHGYTDAAFRSDLRRQMAAAFMRDQIAASVPLTAEQVHVQQILLYDESTAQKALSELKAGWKFTDLAARYDPTTKGELGWFPRGYLSDPVIETAAFALQPGEYSDVIQTQAGYDILFVAAREPDRPLSPDALLTLQERALQDWLDQKRSESAILIAE
jgi:peptidyl-prolyl cis-trans isomerase C